MKQDFEHPKEFELFFLLIYRPVFYKKKTRNRIFFYLFPFGDKSFWTCYELNWKQACFNNIPKMA